MAFLNPGTDAMHTVRVPLNGSKFTEDIGEIQEWIDQIGFTVQRFDYELDEFGKLISVRMGFLSSEEAEIFCTQFDGHALPP